MKIISKFFAALFGIAAIAMAVFTVRLAFNNKDATPVLLKEPDSAHLQVVEMMDAFCEGDFAAAQKRFYGATDLGMGRAPADEVGQMIWAAFQESMTYELVGELYATDSGLSQDLKITTMDMNAVTAVLKETVKPMIEERVLNAEDTDLIYDDDDQYRDEFIQQVVRDALTQAIEANTATVETELTLNLVWSDDKWWVVSNEALLKAVSGGIV